MITATATPAAGTQAQHDSATRPGCILVATDGTSGSDAAVRAAGQLARLGHESVIVLAVLPPAPLVASEFGVVLPPDDNELQRRQALEERVRDQVEELLIGVPCRREVRTGDPAATIARSAASLEARLIVIGVGHHDLLDRLFGSETALHALRMSRVPLFIVPPSFSHLPVRVVVGTDFSEGSLAASRTALDLFPQIDVVHLAHVAPRVELQPEAYAAWISEYGTGVDAAFARFRSELGSRPGLSIDTTTLTGKPSRALLDFAKSTNVDAIVIGSQGHSLLDRLLVGSTATAIVRGAQCAVIAVPGEGNQARAFAPLPQSAWATALTEFTRRNAGRAAMLEVDDPEIGAQAQQRGYRFQGAAWDHHDHRIEIMLGDPSSTSHLTRGIGEVRSVDVMQDAAGHDLVLRVAHGEGQTLLTFIR